MAVIAPTIIDVSALGDGSCLVATWTPVTEADTCAPVKLPKHATKWVQASGTFGSSSTAMQGSIDGTNFVALNSVSGSAIALTAAGIKPIYEEVVQIKPVTTGGTAQSITISMSARFTNPARQ